MGPNEINVRGHQKLYCAKLATLTFYNVLIHSFAELFSRKERESISDHEARREVIENLKKMIRSWLDETFPQMEEQEKVSRAQRMDISLVEQVKEENMKTIYELNSVVRMSFIEMQFIKKEMMNAMHAMDQMVRFINFDFRCDCVVKQYLTLD